MRTGIIGLPQVGKTSLFTILTGAHLEAHANPREAHLGVAKVPDERLDQLVEMYQPKKVVHASIEYADVAAIGQDVLKDTAYATALRNTEALAHVLRAFENPAVPHLGPIDPPADIRKVELDLMISDLGQIEKRLERLEKDVRKMRSPDLEKELALMQRAKSQLESERPLREMELSADDEKRLRGFLFLSQKPMLYVLNVNETPELGRELEQAVEKYGLGEFAHRPRSAATAICGTVEAELAAMSPQDAAEFLAGYGLRESGLVRLVRTTYELLGLISFFTVGENECHAWAIPRDTRAVDAAGVIHSDLARHFIRGEVIAWDLLLAAGSEANARAQGTLRLEGKDYILKDGEIMHVRHGA